MDATADRLVLFLVPHLYLTVFVASAVDAVGIPFPGRILLVLAGAFASSRAELALAIVASALGSLLGDHVVYLAGARRGDTLLALYCRQRALFLIMPTAIAAIVGYRLWRRRRHGAARGVDLCGPSEPERNRTLR